MAAITKGTAHLYAVVSGTITNASVQSFSIKQSFANTSETVNESGNVIERRYDDRTTEVVFELKIQSGYTMPSLGDQITFNSILYVIETIDRKEEAKGHVMITLTAKKSEGITLV